MYVCVCHSITDRDIHEAIRRGARTLDELQDGLGIATTCGTCRNFACEMLEDGLARSANTAGQTPSVPCR
ncbi:bacterioferritin-associated ferredoxin [Thioflavicoccus mobilis 8321]|uniref:Bacterioferritin-associated ferredoxin n=1 Tax=Thioflavicoccus mobilis 8321 TaxID=765912 RepID=L0GZJ5_9GAMM|nr:(2Fe-2S)-binding protein [Thioflavicoccus mobilis]AGA90805.1 bacterioferritin-associated ferredoxin [Thioflavicoccus mobilis 8321]